MPAPSIRRARSSRGPAIPIASASGSAGTYPAAVHRGSGPSAGASGSSPVSRGSATQPPARRSAVRASAWKRRRYAGRPANSGRAAVMRATSPVAVSRATYRTALAPSWKRASAVKRPKRRGSS
ncbi:hypothetical protein SGRI78S_03569 [Streptomyces griseus subsp. griseus]